MLGPFAHLLDHVTSCCFCSFRGICPFGGVLFIRPFRYEDDFTHGTFCNDGSLALPEKTTFSQDYVIIASYSLQNDINLHYKLTNKSFEESYKMQFGRLSSSIVTHKAIRIDHFFYTYDTKYPFRISFRYKRLMVTYNNMNNIIVINSITGKCTHRHDDTYVNVKVRRQRNFTVLMCGDFNIWSLSQLYEIYVYLWPNEIVSIFNSPYVELNSSITHSTVDDTLNRGSVKNVYNLIFVEGFLNIFKPTASLELVFDKLISYQQYHDMYMYDIHLTGYGRDRSPLHIFLSLQMHGENVEFHYQTNDRIITIRKPIYYKAAKLLVNLQWLIMIGLICFKR